MPSCWPVPPLQPIAPTILPPTTIGMPPSEAITPSSVIAATPAGPDATRSSNTLVGRLKIAAARALCCEIVMEAYWQSVHPLEIDEIAGRSR